MISALHFRFSDLGPAVLLGFRPVFSTEQLSGWQKRFAKLLQC